MIERLCDGPRWDTDGPGLRFSSPVLRARALRLTPKVHFDTVFECELPHIGALKIGQRRPEFPKILSQVRRGQPGLAREIARLPWPGGCRVPNWATGALHREAGQAPLSAWLAS